MNSGERVKIALRHCEREQVPFTASFTPEFSQRWRNYFGLPSHFSNPQGEEAHDLEKILGLDIIWYPVRIGNSFYTSEKKEYIGDWGIKWQGAEYVTPLGEIPYFFRNGQKIWLLSPQFLG